MKICKHAFVQKCAMVFVHTCTHKYICTHACVPLLCSMCTLVELCSPKSEGGNMCPRLMGRGGVDGDWRVLWPNLKFAVV